MAEDHDARLTQKINRMDKRRLKTRQLLLDSAIKQLIEKELEDITPEDITEDADVGRRTFYNHFDNKKECVLAAVKQRFVSYATSAATYEERDLDPVFSLTKSSAEVFDSITKDPITKRLIPYPRLLADAIEQSQQEFLYRDLASGFMSGKFRPTTPVNALKPIIHWGFVGLVIDTVSNPNSQNTGLDWSKVMLFNLGVSSENIEQIFARFK